MSAVTPCKKAMFVPRNRNFQRHMEDHSIYPNRFIHPDGTRAEKPSNLAEINEDLHRQRPTDDPIPETVFKDFCDKLEQAQFEPSLMASILHIIEGEVNPHWHFAQDCLFSNIEPLTDVNLVAAKPDRYYGACPRTIHPLIHEKLFRLISPSTAGVKPWVPNFFLEVQTRYGSPRAVKNQALYDGAIGARGVQAVRCSGAENSYSDEAYTIMVTLCEGSMVLYTSHIGRKSCLEGRPERFMTQICAFELTDSLERFKAGVTAYRNAKGWAEEKRKEMIEAANTKAAEALLDPSCA